ncbi:hypothetical protein ABBQ38_014366 [Trebouxia sp. C0009 RCD-2024]
MGKVRSANITGSIMRLGQHVKLTSEIGASKNSEDLSGHYMLKQHAAVDIALQCERFFILDHQKPYAYNSALEAKRPSIRFKLISRPRVDDTVPFPYSALCSQVYLSQQS